jgi:ribosomal protein S18 acetylase RimI-like enzyme
VSASPEPRLRRLLRADTRAVRGLLAPRAVQNVVLDHLVRAGSLGRVAGVLGWERGGALDGVLMVGALGATWVEIHGEDVPAAVARDARSLDVPPRQIAGPEAACRAFCDVYRRHTAGMVWDRRELVYVADGAARARAAAHARPRPPLHLRRARRADLAGVIERSAAQHREDLGEDRRSLDVEAFDRRHTDDIEQARWWLAEVRHEVVFQVHVGARSEQTVQIAGVYTPAASRGRGYATAAIEQLVDRLLQESPAVSLCCAEGNAVARRLYERVGFSVLAHNRSCLVRLER